MPLSKANTIQYIKRHLEKCVADEATRRRFLGLFYIFLVAIIWISASFLVQALVSNSQGGHAPMHPFVLTYICNSLFLLYLGVAAWKDRKCHIKRGGGTHRTDSNDGADVASSSNLLGHTKPQAAAAVIEAPVVHDTAVPPAGELNDDHVTLLGGVASWEGETWKVTKAALAVAPIWFLAQLCFNYSLLYTSVTSNTVLSSPASLFTYLLSVLTLKERFTFSKLIAVLLTVVGTITVATADARLYEQDDKTGPHDGVLGDMLTLLAAVLYACYTVTLRVMMPDDDEDTMLTFFGYLGLINFVGFLPFLFFLEVAGHVSLMAIGALPLMLAFIKGLFDNALSDYLWARAILLVGPTIATVGLSIQVPIAMFVDPLFHEYGWWSETETCLLELLGAFLILSGFVAVSMDFSFQSCL